MDILSFIVEIVRALAWPLAILVLVFLFRRPLTQLLPQLRKLQYKEWLIYFGEQLEAIKQEAKTVLTADGDPDFSVLLVSEKQRKLAEISPRGAILEAWITVEKAVSDLEARYQKELRQQRGLKIPQLLFELEKAGIIDQGTANMYSNLRALRNQAVHASDPLLDSNVAIGFADLSARLVKRLENPNRVKGSFELPLPTPPCMRVRTGRFTEHTEP